MNSQGIEKEEEEEEEEPFSLLSSILGDDTEPPSKRPRTSLA